MAPLNRFLVHGRDYRYRVLDPGEVFFIEADGDETLIRLRGRRRLRDVRSFGEVMAHLGPRGILEIHRGIAVNLSRVFEVRRRAAARGWEVRLEPPVNRVLPVSEARRKGLVRALEGG